MLRTSAFRPWLAVVLLCSCAALATAQEKTAAAVDWRHLPGQSLHYLLLPQIVEELEIVPEQREKLAKLQKESQERLTESYKKVNDVPAEERNVKYYELMRANGEKVEQEIRELLLPMQLERLRQIVLQQKLAQAQWGGSPFNAPEFIEALDITAEQQAALVEKEKEIRADIQKKTQEFYKKIQEESRAKMLEVLTAEQRAKLEKVTGKPFEWKYTAPVVVRQPSQQ